MTVWAWVGLYFVSQTLVPPKKKCRGLFTRYVLARIVPPKRWWVVAPWNDSYRYFVWLAANLPVQYTLLRHERTVADMIFWGGYILLLLDDHVFGDDDRWRRFREWCGNKIKWKMVLPEPVAE